VNDSELTAALAEAEAHYTHYEWDEAIRCFDAVLAAAPGHAAATQGRTDALQQQRVAAELTEMIAAARVDLEEGRYGAALAALNHAQARAALRHILKYHAEIDGLRIQAQEALEWQRRVEEALGRAKSLARQGDLDGALQTLDAAWNALTLRGCEALGEELRRERDRLWAERDLGERIRYATVAFERQDYRLAVELAETLQAAAPGRQDLRRLAERSRQAWAGLQERLAASQAALDAGRLDEAIALLAKLQGEAPKNPDWQALWLRAHIDHGREGVQAGRAAFRDRRLEDAGPHFAAASHDFEAALAVFDQHPTAAQELEETEALAAMAALAVEADRDTKAGRWEGARHSWEAAREKLQAAVAVRRRDFGEVAAVAEALRREAVAAVDDLDAARALLAEGRAALAAHDAGRARQCFRDGLARAGTRSQGLAGELSAGLAEAERAQRQARGLIARAERAADGEARLDLLGRAYDTWRTAPGLAGQLAGLLLETARRGLERGDEALAAGCCERALGIEGAPPEIQEQAAALRERIGGRRQVQAALDEADRLIGSLAAETAPSPEGYRQVIGVLMRARAPAGEDPALRDAVLQLLAQAEAGHAATTAAAPHLERADALAACGDWDGAAAALAEAARLLGDHASPYLDARLREWQAVAARTSAALAQGRDALADAEVAYGRAADGDLDAVPWDDLAAALERVQTILAEPPAGAEPLPLAWTELRAAAAGLAGCAGLLQQTYARVQAGRGVDALPELAAALTADGGADPVLAAVQHRLQGALAGDARAAVAARVAEARRRLAAGDLGPVLDLLSQARLYGEAAAGVQAEIAGLEGQIERVRRIGVRADEARSLEAGGPGAADDGPDALAAYRAALELAGEPACGFPAEVRANLPALLELEERLWDPAALDEGRRLRAALEAACAADPLLRSCLPAPLRGWWRLASGEALAAFVKTRLALADYAGAHAAAREAVEARPGDGRALELYGHVREQTRAGLLASLRRRLNRAAQLEREGAYTPALAELAGIEQDLLPPARAILPDLERDDAVAAALDELAALGHRLAGLQALAARLEPAHSRAREAVQAGQVDEALAAIEHAALIDPQRRISSAWAELDPLAARLVERRAAAARDRLETALDEAEALLDLGLPPEGVRRAVEVLTSVQPLLRALGEEEAAPLRRRLGEVRGRAVVLWHAANNGSGKHADVSMPPAPARTAEQLPRPEPVRGLLAGDQERPFPPPFGFTDPQRFGAPQDVGAPHDVEIPGNGAPAPQGPGAEPHHPAHFRTDKREAQSAARPEPAPAPAPTRASEPPEAKAAVEFEVGPFDVDDWLRNVTPVAEDDDEGAR
jgi:hypothetical protein